MSITKLYTANDLLAMGSDANFELVDGELREISLLDFRSSVVATEITAPLHNFVYRHKLGRLTGPAGYVLATNPDTVFAPTIGFTRDELFLDGLPHGFMPCPPDLAIEVISAWGRIDDFEYKARRYIQAGSRLVWVILPIDQTVIVFAPGRPVQTLGIGDVLDGEVVVPGFRLPLADVFRDPLA